MEEPISPVVPARGEFPEGLRVAAHSSADSQTWELVWHPEGKFYSLRWEPGNNAWQISSADMIELAEFHGTCLPKKLAKALQRGLMMDGWEPGTYVLCRSDDTSLYGLRMSELVAIAVKMVADTAMPIETVDEKAETVTIHRVRSADTQEKP